MEESGRAWERQSVVSPAGTDGAGTVREWIEGMDSLQQLHHCGWSDEVA